MIKDLFLVGLGSCVGGILRYLIALAMKQPATAFPWATFTVNIIGCLFIGVLWALCSRLPNCSDTVNLLLMVGFCGGFTTFSTFSKEGLTLLQSGQYLLFLLYALGSVVVGLLAVAGGFWLAK